MGSATSDIHTRNNAGVTAHVERRLLIWIAERLPRWLSSDHLSAMALGALAGAGLSFAAFPYTTLGPAGVVASLFANWFGDSLDGTVARVRGQQRPRYGFYVDHVLDLAGTTMLVAGMGASGLMSPLIAAAVLVAYLLAAAESFLATHATGVFRMSFMGFGPTELRLVLMAGAIMAAHSVWIEIADGVQVKLFDLGGIIAAVGLTAAFVVTSARNIRALYLAEPVQPRRSTA